MHPAQACEFGRSPYFEPSRGTNMWEYWFNQPGAFRLGMRSVRGRQVRSLQMVSVDRLQHPVRAYSGADEYRSAERNQVRLAARAVVGLGGVRMVREPIRRKAATLFAEWRRRSAHVLGMHVRGTDKVVQPKVPPEAYFPFVDVRRTAEAKPRREAWRRPDTSPVSGPTRPCARSLSSHAPPPAAQAYMAAHADALLFVATDDAGYLRRVRARYGATARLVTAAAPPTSL
eukprot:5861928-Prymnesium_polylepis.2